MADQMGDQEKNYEYHDPLTKNLLKEKSGFFSWLKLLFLVFATMLVFFVLVYCAHMVFPNDKTSILDFFGFWFLFAISLGATIAHLVVCAKSIGIIYLNIFEHKNKFLIIILLFFEIFSGPIIAFLFKSGFLAYFFYFGAINFSAATLCALLILLFGKPYLTNIFFTKKGVKNQISGLKDKKYIFLNALVLYGLFILFLLIPAIVVNYVTIRYFANNFVAFIVPIPENYMLPTFVVLWCTAIIAQTLTVLKYSKEYEERAAESSY